MRFTAFASALLVLGACQPPTGAQDAPAKTWAFEPARDTFSKDALWDLRSLNEPVAGQSGYVATDGRGGFRLGNGEPVRFWCVNSMVGREKPWAPRPLGRQTEPDLAHHARWLAKRGVNMVRLHAQISPDLEGNPQAKLEDINAKERDWIWRAIAAYKKEGIYLTVSPYWGVPMKFAQHWGIAGGTEQSALGLLYFDEKLQAAYKAWLRALFAETNPYTGIALAKDPALAVFQIQNEDSLLFWTVNAIQGEQRRNLGRKFAAWAGRKHGGLDQALTQWDRASAEGDDLSAGVLGFYNIWEMTQDRQGGMNRRLADQLEFWAATMHDFNKEIGRFVREDLGCKALVNAGNWRTASSERLYDAERWSYTANDVDAVNHYFGGIHRGDNEGWAIVNGDRFTSVSALREPWRLPINVRQTKNRPILVTESAWVPPNDFGSEGPFLIAAYSALNGVDGYYWFATGDDEWTPPTSANGYMPSLMKWTFATPDVVGGFPGAALMFRRGDIKEAPPALLETRPLQDVWDRKPPALAEEAGFDPNRDTTQTVARARPDARTFLEGPVAVEWGGSPSVNRAASKSEGSLIRSLTGEIQLDYAKGYCTVDTPRTQGVSAFFRGSQPFVLSTVTFEGGNEHATALAVSLDGQPIATSKKVLIQVTTQSRPTGWKDEAATIDLGEGRTTPGRRVVNYGAAPWQLAEAAMKVTIKNASLTKATRLDANAMTTGSVPVEKVAGGVRFEFPKSGCLSVVLEAP